MGGNAQRSTISRELGREKTHALPFICIQGTTLPKPKTTGPINFSGRRINERRGIRELGFRKVPHGLLHEIHNGQLTTVVRVAPRWEGAIEPEKSPVVGKTRVDKIERLLDRCHALLEDETLDPGPGVDPGYEQRAALQVRRKRRSSRGGFHMIHRGIRAFPPTVMGARLASIFGELGSSSAFTRVTFHVSPFA